MSQAITRNQPPKNVKNYRLAFLLLGILMVTGQVMNFIITLLPSSEDAVLDLGDGTTISVASLSDSYLTLVMIFVVVYGLTWYFLIKNKGWARWAAVVLAILSALGSAQGLLSAFAAQDTIGITLNLAQLVAAGWVLALAFRPEVHAWFTGGAAQPKA